MGQLSRKCFFLHPKFREPVMSGGKVERKCFLGGMLLSSAPLPLILANLPEVQKQLDNEIITNLISVGALPQIWERHS